jgi:aspartyl-tRNA(Asn)/glutamyl-tRNA(Gln) amidotransferase subunit A
MHEGALGGTTDNPHHGRAHNPWRHGFTPGGSSGGSGAAAAARLCAAALGTDTMGSVRMPAAYCGVAGIKPTFGLVSSQGLGLLCGPLDHIGPLARSVRDLGLMLDSMAGACAGDPFCRAAPDGWRAQPDGAASLRGVKVGLLANFDAVELEPDVAHAFAASLDLLRREGAAIERLEIFGYEPARARLAGLLWSEADGAVEHEAAPECRFSPGFRAMLDFGARAPAAKLAKAQRLLRRIGCEFNQLFERVELIVAPTTPQTAFSFDAKSPVNQGDLMAPANFAGCPALSLPCGLSSDGLPIGLQFFAAPWREQRLLALALGVEAGLGFAARPSL